MGVNLLTKTIATTYSQVSDWLYMVVGGVDRRIVPEDFFKARDGNRTVTFYGTLSAAVTAIGASQVTLLIPATTTVSASLTIPSNITLEFTGPGMISVSSGQTLTINGPLIASLRQIFAGAGSVRFGPNIGISYPQWFGAAFNNSTDDAAAIQKAIDVFNSATATSHGGIVEITGGAVINSTLTIIYNSIKLRGQGWGVQATTPYRSFIRWNGSAGSPMVLITEAWGSGVEDLRLIGKSSAKPSAAIEIRDNVAGLHGQDFSYTRNVYIGDMGGYDDDNAKQFTTGLLLSGTVNGDGNTFTQTVINGCDIGVHIPNQNATTTHIDGLTLINNTVGIKTKASIVIDSWQNGLNGTDLEFDSPGVFVDVRLYQSEGAGRMAVFGSNADCSLIIRSGSFGNDATHFTPADSGNNRWLIDAGAVQGAVSVHLENFLVVTQGSNPKTHVLRIGHVGAGSAPLIRLIDVRGIEAGNILLGLAGSSDKNKGPYVEILRKRSTGVAAHEYSRNFIDANRAEDRDYQDLRTDFPGKVNIFGGPLKVKKIFVPTAVAVTPTGSGATGYSYRVTALTYDGETEASAAVTTTNAATLTASVYNTVSWVQSQGAYAYRIYGRTAGSEQLMKTLTLGDLIGDFTYRDTGVDTPSGAFPTVNTTGNAYVEGVSELGRVMLAPSAGITWQDITATGTAGIRLGGGDEISDGPSFQIFPDAGTFPGMYFDAGSNSGSDILFRKSPSGPMAFKIKQGTGAIELDRTITAAGTTGAQTINKIAGTVNIAAGNSSVVVTNSLVNANSLIYVELRTNDATARIANYVPASGSFTINLTAAATGEVSIGWLVLN